MELRRRDFLAVTGAHVGLLAGGGCGTAESDRITIGAMPPGTSWYVFAATLSQLLQRSLPGGARVEVVARGGGIGNPILVDRGQETIAISQAATASWAYNGNPAAYDRQHRNLRALVGGLNRVWMAAMLTEEYVERTGNATLRAAILSDAPVRIVMKPRGSTVPVVADMLLESLGTSREGIVGRGGTIVQVTANQIASIMRDGRADLYLETAIRGHPTLTEVATTTPVRFVNYPEETISELLGPGIERTPMPVWFPGQSEPLDSVDMGTVLITHRDAPFDLARLITKTVCENKAAMASAHRAWEDFDPRTAARPEKTGVPLHPGAEDYYRQRDWL